MKEIDNCKFVQSYVRVHEVDWWLECCVWHGWLYNSPAIFQSVNTSYLREYTWCDVVKEVYSHRYNFMRTMLKDFIHVHNVTLLFNLPLVNQSKRNSYVFWPTVCLLLTVPYCYITPQLVLSNNMPHLPAVTLWLLMPIGRNTTNSSLQLNASVAFFHHILCNYIYAL